MYMSGRTFQKDGRNQGKLYQFYYFSQSCSAIKSKTVRVAVFYIINHHSRGPNGMLQIKENVVSLRGMSLRGSFELFNPNQNLAVVFEISPPSRIALEVEPKRGIIMQRQLKKIKVWVQKEYREAAVASGSDPQSIRINMTMKTEYNRKVFEKLQMRGWEQISGSHETAILPIIISPEARELRSSIREQVSHSLSKTYGSRESIQAFPPDPGFKQGRVYTSGIASSHRSQGKQKIDRKIRDQFSNLFDSPSNNVLMRPTPPRDSIMNSRSAVRSNFYPKEEDMRESKSFNDWRGKQNYQEIPSSVPLRDFSRAGSQSLSRFDKVGSTERDNKRFMQVLLLAALAGFFLALGSNLKHLII